MSLPTRRKWAISTSNIVAFTSALVKMVTIYWSQVLTCLDSRNRKSPMKVAVPVEHNALACILPPLIQLTSLCICPSRMPVKLRVLVLPLQAGVFKPCVVFTFAPVNIVSELKSIEMKREALT